MAKTELHTVAYKRNLVGYNFLPLIMANAYQQEDTDWHMRIMDNHDGNLDMDWAFKIARELNNCDIDINKVSYYTSPNINNNLLCNKRDLLFQFSDCDYIFNFDDDDFYPANYILKCLEFLNTHQCIFIMDEWLYDLPTQKYILTEQATGANRYGYERSLINRYDMKYCVKHCLNGGRFRNAIGVCREKCLWSTAVDKKQIKLGYMPRNKNFNPIRIIHEDALVGNKSKIKAMSQFRNDKHARRDKNFEWLHHNMPISFAEYYINNVS